MHKLARAEVNKARKAPTLGIQLGKTLLLFLMPLDIPKCPECEIRDGEITCLKCEENLCQICDQKRHLKGKMTRHIRYPYQGLETLSRYCSIKDHEDIPLKLYCNTCLKPICSTCVIEEHKQHLWISIQLASENIKMEIKQNLILLEEQNVEIEKEIKIIESELKIKKNKID